MLFAVSCFADWDYDVKMWRETSQCLFCTGTASACRPGEGFCLDIVAAVFAKLRPIPGAAVQSLRVSVHIGSRFCQLEFPMQKYYIKHADGTLTSHYGVVPGTAAAAPAAQPAALATALPAVQPALPTALPPRVANATPTSVTPQSLRGAVYAAPLLAPATSIGVTPTMTGTTTQALVAQPIVAKASMPSAMGGGGKMGELWPLYETKMKKEGLNDAAIAAFKYNYSVLTSGQDTMIPESSISPVDSLPSYESLNVAEDSSLLRPGL